METSLRLILLTIFGMNVTALGVDTVLHFFFDIQFLKKSLFEEVKILTYISIPLFAFMVIIDSIHSRLGSYIATMIAVFSLMGFFAWFHRDEWNWDDAGPCGGTVLTFIIGPRFVLILFMLG